MGSFSGFFKNFLPKLLPLAASFIPGIGPLGAAALGAAGGALGGGGLKGALLGGLGGGLGAGGLGAGLGSSLGLGAGASKLFGNVLGGAVGGAGNGGLKGALLGGLGGAGSSLLQGGGLGDTGDFGRIDEFFTGDAANLGNGLNVPELSAAGGGGSSFGGIGEGIGNAVSGAADGGFGFSDLASAAGNFLTDDRVKDALLKSQTQSLGELSPYLQTGKLANNQLQNALRDGTLGGEFTPGDLTQDPGYQFRLQQGEQALGRGQAARGNYFSGSALKAAQDYGQGLADQTYNDAHSRWLQDQNNTYGILGGTAARGQQGAGAAADIYDNFGNIKANSAANQGNIFTRALSQFGRPKQTKNGGF